MSDHEFEKQVQRKMDELKLRPSDAVWTAVEQNIRPSKPRRRFGFWLPAALVILTTSGYLLYSENVFQIEKAPTAQSKTIITSNDHPSTKNNAHKDNNSTPTATDHPSADNTVTDNITSKNNSPINGAHPEQQQDNVISQQHLEKPVQPVPDGAHATVSKKTTAKPNTLSNAARVPYNKPARVGKAGKNTFVPAGNATTGHAEETSFFATPQLAPNEDAAIATGKAATAPLNKRLLTMPEKTATAAVPPIDRKKGPRWQWGGNANVGFSRITQSNLLQLNGWIGSPEKSLAEDLSKREQDNTSGSPMSYNSFINTAPVPEKKPAAIQQDLAYNVGVYAQRPLSKRLRLTIGLNYGYMSAHTNIGKLVDMPTIVNMGSSSANVVTRYYTSVDAVSTGLNVQWSGVPDSMVSHKYTYRFHSIEVPVTVNWQINKGRQLPPFVLDAGLSIAQLLSVDALHYDGVKGIYYKDDNLINKTHVNAMLGFNVGLFQQSKTPVWIGPSLRYSLTGLVDKSVSNGQFMWSTGVNARIQLGSL